MNDTLKLGIQGMYDWCVNLNRDLIIILLLTRFGIGIEKGTLAAQGLCAIFFPPLSFSYELVRGTYKMFSHV